MMAEKLSLEEIKHIAKLSRIGLSDKEQEAFKSQLSAILDFVSKLQEIDTQRINPLSQTTGLKNVFREDEILPSLLREDVLKNAPESHNGYFKVKPAL